MTATAIPQSLPAHTWNGLLKLAALLAVAVVLVAGSFAMGRSTADDSTTIVRHVIPYAGAINPANDMPPVSLHTGVTSIDVPPAATDASCGRTAHTPPC